MNFLYPQLLFGLFALAIPVIIHLFNFRRTKKLYFSNTSFLKEVKESSSSKLKVKHYLILLARLLFVLFLVLAFAQPYVNSENTATASDKMIIYLDNSLSMSTEAESGVISFEEAVSYANGLLEAYPKSTNVQFLTNDFSAFSNSFRSVEEVKEQLTKVNQTGIVRSASEIYQRLSNTQISDTIDVFWISDFQQSTTGEAIQLDSLYRVNILPVRPVTERNISIDSVYLYNPFLIGDNKLKLNVIINNRGDVPADEMNIKAFVNEALAATAVVSIPANDKFLISFDITHSGKAANKGRVSIEDYPVTFDNDFYFVLNKQERIKILEIRGASGEDYFQKVYANNEIFNFTSYDAGNLDYSKLSEVDLVVLNGIDRIETSLGLALNKLREKNTTILLSPGISPEITSYQLLSSKINKSLSTDTMLLASPDTDNPFYENIFEEENVRFSMPSARMVLNTGLNRTALLKFQNGQEFLNEDNDLFVLTAPIKAGWSTFQNHALFVPVMYRIAANSISESQRIYYYTSENSIRTTIESFSANSIYKLHNGEQELIPVQQVVDGQLRLEVPKYLLQSGFYDLKLEEQNIRMFAFNHPTVESELATLSNENMLQLMRGNTRLMDVNDYASLEKELKNRFEGIPLWKYALILALMFLLAEVLLIRFLP